jgi:hypothetical protein
MPEESEEEKRRHMKSGKSKTGVRHEVATPSEGVERRGRKHISESRAAEIRKRLLEWKQIPEATRISLRALAAAIGTSHQLLSFYLRQWDKWQTKEYQRKPKEICARAHAEKRVMTHQEQAQVVAYGRAALQEMTKSIVPDILTALRKDVKCGKLSRQRLRLAKLLARRGYGREIQEILGVSGERICKTKSLEGGKC